MANHKKKPGYHGCQLCEPHKAMGNSKAAIKPQHRKLHEVFYAT